MSTSTYDKGNRWFGCVFHTVLADYCKESTRWFYCFESYRKHSLLSGRNISRRSKRNLDSSLAWNIVKPTIYYKISSKLHLCLVLSHVPCQHQEPKERKYPYALLAKVSCSTMNDAGGACWSSLVHLEEQLWSYVFQWSFSQRSVERWRIV